MEPHDSFFIDQAAAAQAVQLVLPMIEAAMQSREAGASGFLYIVIMRPGSAPTTDIFEDAILLEHAVGDRNRWDADYAAFARANGLDRVALGDAFGKNVFGLCSSHGAP